MKIVVVGGSGLIGSRVVPLLTSYGHDIVAASPRSGVDAVTGEGLAEALSGAAVVIDVSNSPSFEDVAVMKFFKTCARHDSRDVVADPHARCFGTELDERSLVAGDDAQLGEIRFEDWLGRAARRSPDPSAQPAVVAAPMIERSPLAENEFRIGEVPPGSVLLVGDVAVFNVDGRFCGSQAKCTHRQGPLGEGTLDGSTVTCPWHGAQFNACTGAVLRGPAKDPLKTCRVIVDGEVGRLDAPVAHAVQGV